MEFVWNVKHNRFALFRSLSLACLLLTVAPSLASDSSDPHYNALGFFDVHVCNWPGRPLFFLALFSTTQYEQISSIEVYDNREQRVGELDLSKYRLLKDAKTGKEKHAVIKHLDIPTGAGDGWYSVRVHRKDGEVLTARDYVVLQKLERPAHTYPAAGANLRQVPETLHWDAIPGAQYYRVFIQDIWEDKNIFKSELLQRPEVKLPGELLHQGGLYCWQIHARDTNEHELLGDFNHGSLTDCMEFEIL